MKCNLVNQIFKDLPLAPPLFYRWPIGIRFELGVNYLQGDCYKGSLYLENVYERAITLFEAIFEEEDELLLVVNHLDRFRKQSFKRKFRFVEPFLIKKLSDYEVSCQVVPDVFEEESEESFPQLMMKCKRSEIKYRALIKEICNHDMGFEKSLYHDVFFIHLKNKVIFHVYDDRGCDVIAIKADQIRFLYERYNDWILSYDRLDINKVFLT
ncbi:hypothetical protein AJ85_18510 [Alkalihalobacillus alcalophilus ATCC 27647 = CGMCC 1.3604]|uniref:DUF3885 domain-containing protein n=1 Tax=Alkalihalobacillus alcalophilus ATCC 27647 = CGMCC 1.3604 TaxID=1218173 RepID=A0A094XH37_ALKAL|nr:DUF3885 domain-containing protein [Alkalihalobacillus alcalophilus]KGA98110.1 hypothetical protein BALCAV_0206170 [Alkalihalobacillus alcalophilus ATCC 27647 = CGMCC 1.3604]MED1561448.1 DUF3885 domain-containing protein [Alkalihalobacillus alcalophilus]THG89287.1 hypothetical protein AJ85_18510 [Alkalihalobacillus alcalophilus ATCC 27647 = CGMCC 1.3604]